jgi:hypothetical protein
LCTRASTQNAKKMINGVPTWIQTMGTRFKVLGAKPLHHRNQSLSDQTEALPGRESGAFAGLQKEVINTSRS